MLGRIRTVKTAVAVASALLLAAPANLSAQVFEPETFTLDNGMEVVVVSNHRAPIVSHMVWYKVGAADEPEGKSGIAHFLEHLMFKGTKTMKPGEFSEIIALNGGRENAFTSQDFTGYYQTVSKDRLELMMKHEADRMANLVLTDDVVLPERDVILEERRSRTDNNPGAQLGEMVNATLYLHHPYGTPVIGWENEMRELDTEDALAFYERWYAPNNAILIVSGDVSAEEVRPLAEKYYGALEARPMPPRERVGEPRQWAPRRVELTTAKVGQPSISINYFAPGYRVAEGNEAYALQVLAEIMGGSTGRLYRELVIEQGIAASAGNYYSPTSYDGTDYTFWISPVPGGDLDELEAALRTEIDKLLADGVTDEEVEGAKQRLVDAAVFARDEVSTAAQVFGRALTAGQSVEDVEDWPNRIAKVTSADVMAAAKEIILPEASVTGVLNTEPSS